MPFIIHHADFAFKKIFGADYRHARLLPFLTAVPGKGQSLTAIEVVTLRQH